MAGFYKDYKKGQATVLVLLLAMLGLTVVMSVSSRSLSDLKQSTYVDSGTKALGVAEAGLQYALSQNIQPPTGGCTTEMDVKSALNISGVQSASYIACNGSTNVVFIPSVLSGQMVQLDVSGMDPMNTKFLNFFWQGEASVEIIYVNGDDTLVRYGFNAHGSARTNGMSEAGQSGGPNCSPDKNCVSEADLQTYTNCSGEIIHSSNDSLIRIKTFYGSSPIIVCAITSGSSIAKDMSMEFVTVTATAKMTDGTTKRVQAQRYPPALPSVFDEAIFTTQPLSK